MLGLPRRGRGRLGPRTALAGSRRLRTQTAADISNIIIHGTPGGMPAIRLADSDAAAVAEYVRSFNATAFEAKPEGDLAAGERFFFDEGKCATCHTAAGTGG
jgi:mono/diheme cytochrome c family protein